MSWVAVAIGAFYVFAGVVVLRSIAMERLIDSAIGAINAFSGKTDDDPLDARRLKILTVGAYLTLTSGVALALLSPFASLVFGANAAVQGGYLAWAENALPPESALDARGRQQTKNAFVIYLAATAFVIWLQVQGELRPWSGAVERLALDVAVIAGAAVGCWAWFNLRGSKPSKPSLDLGGMGDEPLPIPDEPVFPPTRLRLAPERHMWPLWDADTGNNVSPRELDLIDGLAERIIAWDDTWQSTLDGEDGTIVAFATPEETRAYETEGRAIAEVLRRTWPGNVEVHARFAQTRA